MWNHTPGLGNNPTQSGLARRNPQFPGSRSLWVHAPGRVRLGRRGAAAPPCAARGAAAAGGARPLFPDLRRT